MAKISESASKAQLRHHDRQDVVIYSPDSCAAERRVNRRADVWRVRVERFVIWWFHDQQGVRRLLQYIHFL
jgi:hypothetical protein